MPDEFEFIGPTVTYGLNEKYEYEFDHFIAGTKTPFNEDDLDYTDETLLMLANACFAGGAFVRKLMKRRLGGDKDDRKRFHRYYDRAIKHRGQPALRESQLRKIAMRSVFVDLRSTPFREQVLIKARQLDAEHFS